MSQQKNTPKLAFLRAQDLAKKMSEDLPPDPLDSKEDKYTANALRDLQSDLEKFKKQNPKIVTPLADLIKNFEQEQPKNVHETLSRLRAFYKAMEELRPHLPFRQYEDEIEPIVVSVKKVYVNTFYKRFNSAFGSEMAKFKEKHPDWKLETKGSEKVTAERQKRLITLQKNLRKFAPEWEVNETLKYEFYKWVGEKVTPDDLVDCYCGIQAFLTLYQEKDPAVKSREIEKLELNRLSGLILSEVQFLQMDEADIFTVEKEVGQSERTKAKDQKAEDKLRAPPPHAQFLGQKQQPPSKEVGQVGSINSGPPKLDK